MSAADNVRLPAQGRRARKVEYYRGSEDTQLTAATLAGAAV